MGMLENVQPLFKYCINMPMYYIKKNFYQCWLQSYKICYLAFYSHIFIRSQKCNRYYDTPCIYK